MWPNDLKVIYSRLRNLNPKHHFAEGARPYIFQEVIDYGGEAISKREYNDIGAVTEFRYGMELSNALHGNNPLKWFVNWGESWSLLPSKDALVFIDNHDTQRGNHDILTYKSSKLYKASIYTRQSIGRSRFFENLARDAADGGGDRLLKTVTRYDDSSQMAVAFMLAHPFGTPRIMSSFDFNDFNASPPQDSDGNILSPVINADDTCGNGWICEHRWRQIYNMVRFRNAVNRTNGVNNWWDNGQNQIAFCRGNAGFVAINGDRFDLKRTLFVCLPPGIYCDVISGNLENNRCTGKTVKVGENKLAYVEILTSEEDGVLAIHEKVKRKVQTIGI